MPTFEDLPPGKLMYKDSNDVWCEVANVAHEIHFDPAPGEDFTATSTYFIHGDDAVEICVTFAPPHCIRKRLSRKRIRKVLMSIGIPRNIAEVQSRDMVQKLNMNDRAIEIFACLLTDLRFGVGT